MERTETIDIKEVAEIFKLSIETVRKYKQIGLITSCSRKGKKDLYDRAEIVIRKNYIEALQKEGHQLSKIQSYLKEFEKSLPKYLSIEEGKKKILIVDDDRTACGVLEEIFNRGFREGELTIYTANDGESGLVLAKRFVPDLIILDIALDLNMTGIHFYEIVKSEPALQKVKVVFISSVVKFHPPGTFFLGKPIHVADLLEVVSAVCGIKPNEQYFQKTVQGPNHLDS